MASTIFTAPPYDPRRERRRRLGWLAVVVLLATLATLGWMYRNLPYERVVDRFFAALQQKQFETAYGIWVADADWKQHPERYARYPFNDFYRDWGPGGEWGPIRSYQVEGSERPKDASGVVVLVVVNQRAERARVWVEKSDKTLTFSPY